jgi:hypothetical protein
MEARRRAEGAGARERQSPPWLLLLATSLLLLALTVGAVAAATGLLRLPWSITPPPANSVSVTITDLSGWSGADVAAILYEGGPDLSVGRHEGLGSFVVRVDADALSITATLLDEPPFPIRREAHDSVAIVPAGTHTLAVVVSYGLKPYGTWVPSQAPGLWCLVPVTVEEGQSVNVSVDIQSSGICTRYAT